VKIEDRLGRSAEGWGETPLSAAWVWPEEGLACSEKELRLREFCAVLADRLAHSGLHGHPFEISHSFQELELEVLRCEHDLAHPRHAPMPHLAALLCLSPFDLALYDAFGNLHGASPFDLLGEDHLQRDLGDFLAPEEKFAGRRIPEFLTPRRGELPVWHLVGGLDPLEAADVSAPLPQDGHPALLRDWIRRDGLRCLKIKLRGNDSTWDCERIIRVGKLGAACGVHWLSADFNCTVTDPAYVTEILDRLLTDHPRIYGMLLYIEQPFPYDLENCQIDVHGIASRKPLFMDESAHDWKFVRLGRTLGWNGVALKTCKTLTGALLSLCWAKAHGMSLMVQDLTNPMLAQVPHVLLAAHAGTLMGVESNAMQFYPDASAPEARVHPGLYRRRKGVLRLDTLGQSGFGYRLDKIKRTLPAAAFAWS
jgi:L-alanine-DL-glutamate epimerase-like enolase superfamily enzyme